MDQRRHQFAIHLPGLLKVLAESLYSTPKVALRELIQNAHDSCIRRTVEYAEPYYTPRIDLMIDNQHRTLIVEDNGSGLTREEVIEYLSTVGRSYTRELGETLAVLHPERSATLIGQFGMGFLSAFLLAADIRIHTRSAQLSSIAVEWRSSGDIHYELSAAPEIPIGTRVELALKPAAYFLLNQELLANTMLEYADFLATPIYINGNRYPANAMKPPWQANDPESSSRAYIERSFHMGDPLWVLPLDDHTIDLGYDTFKVPLSGFLFVPPVTVASIREYGDAQVYIRQMFICGGERELLPAWAKFVRGVIDSPYLQPTASREGIQKNEAFTAVKEAIEHQLLNGLRRLAHESPLVWKQIIRGHSDVIIGWATADRQFFTEIADIVNFSTSRGLMSLPEYLSITGTTIYYTAQQLETLQQQVIAEAIGLPVIDASWFSVEPFLNLYAEFRPGVRLVKLDHDLSRMFQPISEEDFLSLLDFFRTKGIAARIAIFKPETIPAIMIHTKDADFIHKTRNAINANELPDSISGLLSDYIARLGTEPPQGILYLNAGSELIYMLSQLPASTNRDAVLTLVHQMARLFSGKTLDAVEIIRLFETANHALTQLAGK